MVTNTVPPRRPVMTPLLRRHLPHLPCRQIDHDFALLDPIVRHPGIARHQIGDGLRRLRKDDGSRESSFGRRKSGSRSSRPTDAPLPTVAGKPMMHAFLRASA
jgi:hypothetical protein